jgi:hypothetical protein
VPEEKERISIFLTYGLKSGALDRFMGYMYNHSVYQKRIHNTNYSTVIKDEISSKVNFIDITKSYKAYNNQ